MGLIQPAAGLMGTNGTHAAIREGAQPQCHGRRSRSRARGGKGKLTLARALPSSSLLQMTDLFQAQEVISGLKTHLDPSQAPSAAPPPPPKGAEGPTPAPAPRGGGQGACEQPVLDNPG